MVEAHMPTKITVHCQCCTRPFVKDEPRETGDFSVNQNRPTRNLCGRCRLHQGQAPEQRLKRYEEDVPLILESLKTAAAYAERKEQENKEANRRVASVLQSRERMEIVLKKVQSIHTLRGDGSCTCGIKKACKTAGALYGDRWVEDRLERRHHPDDEYDQMPRRPRESFRNREPWMGYPSQGDGPAWTSDSAG